ncbi:MFS transporter [Liquorilactobacillus capillatus]|uniref:Major facilitator superfamily (MFS) profile domain-containing protein n=1 Tax=Liquorilactobacillus capillatus DSM 19910 TaxID=1423731 RepID=A0A0R1M601_9LACO|nr:MFS transporter [Liquorilactobacillus capillatus]KRL03536.1 hypothetical protein FC81_GL001790 [Liquorilactobacillus capillatus DSM 19910]
MENDRSKKSFKSAILSIALMLMSAQVIYPVLPQMKQYFTRFSAAQVETLMTIPSLGILLAITLSEIIIQRFGRQRVIIGGLLLTLFCGVLPLLISNYFVILGARFCFGVGVGVFNALSISLITEFYRGGERAQLLGYQNSVQNFGAALLSLLVGWLLTIQWKLVFAVYLIAVIPLILVLLYGQGFERSSKVVGKQRCNWQVVLYGIYLLIIYAFYTIMQVKLSQLIVHKGLGNTSIAAAILSSISIVSVVVGLVYAPIFSLFRRYLIPISLLGMGSGFIVIKISYSLFSLALGVILTGIFFALLIPAIYGQAAELSPANSDGLTTTILLVGVNLGIFLSPLIAGRLAQTLFGDSPEQAIKLSIIMFTLLGGGHLLIIFLKNQLSRFTSGLKKRSLINDLDGDNGEGQCLERKR